jgi:signal transduction histidine kinase
VRLIAPAPWWTTQRLFVALAVMSAVALLGLLGTWMLRRQVTKQMAIISDSLRSEAVGKERDRMARELHDTLEQQLSGVALQLDGLDDAIKTNPNTATRFLTLARRMLRYTRLEARRSVWDLRSKILEKQGLEAALQNMAESTNSVKIELQVRGEKEPLPAAVEFHLFRIAQEALANAAKHSHASVITMELDYGAENLRLMVRDNGGGFDLQATEKNPGPHFGLMGMRERTAKVGGELFLETAPQKGCCLSVTVPKTLKES